MYQMLKEEKCWSATRRDAEWKVQTRDSIYGEHVVRRPSFLFQVVGGRVVPKQSPFEVAQNIPLLMNPFKEFMYLMTKERGTQMSRPIRSANVGSSRAIVCESGYRTYVLGVDQVDVLLQWLEVTDF